MRQSRRPLLVSFSGIDGAGKSTQISMLQTSLTAAGLRYSLLTFWDNVAVLSRVREFASHAVFRGDRGVGSPERPIHRKDKNVQSWPMAMVRLFLYIVDGLHLALVAAKGRSRPVDVVIFDRYIYDELANLPLQRWHARAYVHLLLKLTPQPDVAYLLDADALDAWRRKREYPLAFVEHNRAAYLRLSAMIQEVSVIQPGSAAESHERVVKELAKRLPDSKLQRCTCTKAFIDA